MVNDIKIIHTGDLHLGMTFKSLGEKSEEYELASFFLEKSETEVQHKFTPSIEKNSKPILKKVTNSKYSDLKIDETNLDISVKAPEIDEFVPVDILVRAQKIKFI